MPRKQSYRFGPLLLSRVGVSDRSTSGENVQLCCASLEVRQAALPTHLRGGTPLIRHANCKDALVDLCTTWPRSSTPFVHNTMQVLQQSSQSALPTLFAKPPGVTSPLSCRALSLSEPVRTLRTCAGSLVLTLSLLASIEESAVIH